MTRTRHYSHPTRAFPVYCLDWTDDETLLLGGGGGASRSGIANKLKLCKVSKDGRQLTPVFEETLSKEEDAPMTLALDRASSQLVTGINASQSDIQKGENAQCRMFSYGGQELKLVRSQQTIFAEWTDDFPYQKFTALSGRDGKEAEFVAVGTTENKVAILSFPGLTPTGVSIEVEGGDLVDVQWGGPEGLWLAVASASLLTVYEFRSDGLAKNDLRVLQAIPAPTIDGGVVQFRAARFAPGTEKPDILVAFNAALPSRKDKRRTRRAHVGKYAATVVGGEGAPVAVEKEGEETQISEKEPKTISVSWDLVAKREVAGKPITVFDVSADGKLVAFGSSDLSLGMLDARQLAPLLKILNAHSFPPTALKFNPSGTMLVSASADNTVRTVLVPSSFGGSLPTTAVLIILALMVLLLAILIRK